MIKIWGNEPHLGDMVLDLITDPVYREEVRAAYSRALGGENFATLSEFKLPEGGSQLFENISSPIYDDAGAITGLTVFIFDVTDRVEAERLVKESLREKEILLKEIHHRVKNNLQIISSMFNMQKQMYVGTLVEHALQDGQSRIDTMALIHESLYRSVSLARIDMQEYIPALAGSIIDAYSREGLDITSLFDVPQVHLDIDTSIPLALIVNELVSNCMKYAFRGRNAGRLDVSVRDSGDDTLVLLVRDDGPGLAPDFRERSKGSLGLQMVQALAGQLRGSFAIETAEGGGTEARLRFPAPMRT
ncbi:MAG: histidine kinase dimerization/phosphoacceptor domain -containing protein [Spirochaetota bacterium]